MAFPVNKKFIGTILASAMILFSGFTFTPKEAIEKRDEGLKILSKHISQEDLFIIMENFSKSLGFKCRDCHVRSKTDPERLDYESYDNPHKKEALEMMKMTMKINARDFKIKGDFTENFTKNKYMITCYSCHNGSPHPETELPDELLKQKVDELAY
ncbi:MAG: c-type cytochrome [Saprospiraceae bacterium]|jgi:hypothetical protein|nr:MAG: Photosynthetic reaction centre cytochrome C subunit [Candidatus Parvibacillus calidus]MBX2936402.1 c-type cytochrome [Saprospiraceae bacterium]MBK7739212.1 c-type cytochrome [Candidatus Parvibacillus calidus]MCB0592085.1 c-type cytochrome [Saprospiraceae bacterium]MCC7149281.1 c-type cytochrome [Saprospiraceae bacterium]